MDQESWIEKFTDIGAFWLHDGNSKRPHALLTSGNHSNGFFNGSLVIRSPMTLCMVCAGLLSQLDEMFKRRRIGMVVGSAYGAITMAFEVARHIGVCDAGFTEPVEVDGEKEMILKRFPINKEVPTVLMVEDVMTTGGTTRKSIKAVESAGGEVIDFILVLVNRSGMQQLDGRRIVALIDREMPIWTPDECPLCKDGSEAIRPKGTENWSRLTGQY